MNTCPICGASVPEQDRQGVARTLGSFLTTDQVGQIADSLIEHFGVANPTYAVRRLCPADLARTMAGCA